MHLFCHGTMPPKSPHTSPSILLPLRNLASRSTSFFLPGNPKFKSRGHKVLCRQENEQGGVRLGIGKHAQNIQVQEGAENSTFLLCPSSNTSARATLVEKHQVSTKRERKEHWTGASLFPLPFDLQKLQLLRSLQFWKWRSRRRICAESEISEL